jgi:hypothetical protein
MGIGVVVFGWRMGEVWPGPKKLTGAIRLPNNKIKKDKKNIY